MLSFKPNYRMIFLSGIILLPLGIAKAYTEISTPAIVGLLMLFLLFLLLDIFISKNRLKSVFVITPEIVRISKGRDADVRFEVISENKSTAKIRIGIQKPDGVSSDKYQKTIYLNQPFLWKFKGTNTGKYSIENIYFETDSFFGLWSIKDSCGLKLTFRVYPDLISEQKAITAFFKGLKSGIHSLRQIGKGREFEQLRDYLPGDSYEDIHWKATSRRAYPVSKIYRMERTQDVYIIIDSSRLSARNANVFNKNINDHDATILERYIVSALVTGMAAVRNGDNFGLLTFSNKINGFLKAGNGKSHFNSCRDMLYTLKPNIVSPDYPELFSYIGTKIRKRSLLIFLTSMDDSILADNFIQNINVLSKRHVVLVNMMKPFGAKEVFSDNLDSLNEIYESLCGHFTWEKLFETEKKLGTSGVGFSLLENEKMTIDLINQYMNIKQRQIL